MEQVIGICTVGVKHKKHLHLEDYDLVLDARFLPNPYNIPMLKDYNGTDDIVMDWFTNQNHVVSFMSNFTKTIMDILVCRRNPEKLFRILIYCTGGKHRSVYVGHGLVHLLKKLYGIEVGILHVDIDKE